MSTRVYTAVDRNGKTTLVEATNIAQVRGYLARQQWPTIKATKNSDLIAAMRAGATVADATKEPAPDNHELPLDPPAAQ